MPRPVAAIAAAVAIGATCVIGYAFLEIALAHGRELAAGARLFKPVTGIVWLVLTFAVPLVVTGAIVVLATGRGAAVAAVSAFVGSALVVAGALTLGPFTPAGLASVIGFPVSLVLLVVGLRSTAGKAAVVPDPIVPDPQWATIPVEQAAKGRPYPYPVPLPAAAKQRHLAVTAASRRPAIGGMLLFLLVGLPGVFVTNGQGRRSQGRPMLALWQTNETLAAALAVGFAVALLVGVGVMVSGLATYYRHKRLLTTYDVQVNDRTGREATPA